MWQRFTRLSVLASFSLMAFWYVPITDADDSAAMLSAPPAAKVRGNLIAKGGMRVPEDLKVTLHPWDEAHRCVDVPSLTAKVDAAGKFRFDDISPKTDWWIKVQSQKTGLMIRSLSLQGDKTHEISLPLRPAVQSTIRILDEQGQPITGASLASVEVGDGDSGVTTFRRESLRGLGLPEVKSERDGRLVLPSLSAGSTLQEVVIDHPDYAVGQLKPGCALKTGEVATCVLKRGIPLHLTFRLTEEAKRLEHVMVRLYHIPFDSPATLNFKFYPVHEEHLAIQHHPGTYDYFRLMADDHFLTPQVSEGQETPLKIDRNEKDHWEFRALPKVPVKGRVVDTEGKPVVGAYLLGEIENRLANGQPAPAAWSKWCYTEWTTTDDQGNYSIHLAPGAARVRYYGAGLAKPDLNVITIEGTANQQLPEIVVQKLPKIAGTVLHSDGRPAAGVVVRFANPAIYLLPSFTNEAGQFEFTLPGLPRDLETEDALWEHKLIAYELTKPVGGSVSLRLDQPASTSNIVIQMRDQPISWPLSALTQNEKSSEEAVAPQAKGQIGLAENEEGVAVPELDGSLWLNTDKKSLIDFRGQTVFLDFYTTWCGPCRYDFPTVKAVYDRFQQDGVTVIGVHDHSSSHDTIRAHARENDMQMPIVVDYPDGRILKAYEHLGLVAGYPSYLLVDPQGRLITADRTTSGPSLRRYKLEIIRQLILERRARAANVQNP